MEPKKRKVIELRCTHANPGARDPRVRYVCPSSAVLWVLGAAWLISYIALAALRR